MTFQLRDGQTTTTSTKMISLVVICPLRLVLAPFLSEMPLMMRISTTDLFTHIEIFGTTHMMVLKNWICDHARRKTSGLVKN